MPASVVALIEVSGVSTVGGSALTTTQALLTMCCYSCVHTHRIRLSPLIPASDSIATEQFDSTVLYYVCRSVGRGRRPHDHFVGFWQTRQFTPYPMHAKLGLHTPTSNWSHTSFQTCLVHLIHLDTLTMPVSSSVCTRDLGHISTQVELLLSCIAGLA